MDSSYFSGQFNNNNARRAIKYIISRGLLRRSYIPVEFITVPEGYRITFRAYGVLYIFLLGRDFQIINVSEVKEADTETTVVTDNRGSTTTTTTTSRTTVTGFGNNGNQIGGNARPFNPSVVSQWLGSFIQTDFPRFRNLIRFDSSNIKSRIDRNGDLYEDVDA